MTKQEKKDQRKLAWQERKLNAKDMTEVQKKRRKSLNLWLFFQPIKWAFIIFFTVFILALIFVPAKKETSAIDDALVELKKGVLNQDFDSIKETLKEKATFEKLDMGDYNNSNYSIFATNVDNNKIFFIVSKENSPIAQANKIVDVNVAENPSEYFQKFVDAEVEKENKAYYEEEKNFPAMITEDFKKEVLGFKDKTTYELMVFLENKFNNHTDWFDLSKGIGVKDKNANNILKPWKRGIDFYKFNFIFNKNLKLALVTAGGDFEYEYKDNSGETVKTWTYKITWLGFYDEYGDDELNAAMFTRDRYLEPYNIEK